MKEERGGRAHPVIKSHLAGVFCDVKSCLKLHAGLGVDSVKRASRLAWGDDGEVGTAVVSMNCNFSKL